MPRKKPGTKPLSARLQETTIDMLTELLAGTGITLTHAFETAMRDYLAGPRAAAVRLMKEANR